MGSGWRSALFTDGTLRAPWRILLFFALGFVLYVAAALAALTVLGPPGAGKDALFWQDVPLFASLGAGWILLAAVDRRAGRWALPDVAHRPRSGAAFIGGGASRLLGPRVGVGSASARMMDGLYVRTLLVDLAAFAVAAAFEEAAFRGYPFQVLVQAIGPIAATLLASGAFAAAHIGNPNASALGLLNIFLAGVLLSAAYLRTRSLWFAPRCTSGGTGRWPRSSICR